MKLLCTFKSYAASVLLLLRVGAAPTVCVVLTTFSCVLHNVRTHAVTNNSGDSFSQRCNGHTQVRAGLRGLQLPKICGGRQTSRGPSHTHS